MIVYLVHNNDGTTLGLFKKKKKAVKLVKTGKKRWNETWKIESLKLNKIEPWVLAGSETYKEN